MNRYKTAALGAALLGASVLLPAALSTAHAGASFDIIKKRGFVHCGVSDNVPGFSTPDSQGAWHGQDVDMCRALAAAMFHDASKAKITPTTLYERFTALQSGEIDVLVRTTTQTMMRDTTMGLIGTGVNFYDGQTIMVPKSLGISSAKELGGAAICVQPSSSIEMNLADWFRANQLQFRPVTVERSDEIIRAFAAGRCDAITMEKSLLAAMRTTYLENPDDYVILPEEFSKEPLGPMVRQGDEQWFNVVRWTLNAMLEAEEYGITSQNVDEMMKSSNPNVQRILGVTPGMGKNLGLDDCWAYHVIKQIGNYGENFEINFGQKSPLKLERGLNALWRDGGLMYGWPIR